MSSSMLSPVQGTGLAAESASGVLYCGDNMSVLGSAEVQRESPKLIYLDPPFNTGEKFSHYNDSLPSELWLRRLTERLEMLKTALSPVGSIWLHLDDREQHNGRLALDRVFGRRSFVSTVIWQKRVSRDNRRAFSSSHDYLHVYSPAGDDWKNYRNGLPNDGAFVNPDSDPRGPWRSVPLSVQAGHAVASQFYEILSPSGRTILPPRGRCWAYSASRFAELEREGLIYWPRGGDGVPRLKRFMNDIKPLAPSTIWSSVDVGDNALAKKELLRDVDEGEVFATPKPISLMKRIVEISTNEGDLVLDPYLGSGTTAIAAAGAGRSWLGIESEQHTLDHITLPRLKRHGVEFSLRS